MPSFTFYPLRESYSETGGDAVRKFQPEMGPPRLRRDKAARTLVTASWALSAAELQFFFQAYGGREYTWVLTLVGASGGGPRLYNCLLMPGTVSWVPDGARANLTATFEVIGAV